MARRSFKAMGLTRGMSVLSTIMLLSCSAKQTPQSPGANSSEAEFQRCMDQEKYGESRGCWHAFLDQFGNVASTAEVAYAKERLERSGSTTAHSENPDDDPVTRAARTLEARARLQDNNPSEQASSFPAKRVAYDECYKGFQVTGNSERDVRDLGQRCGGPCGMIPFSEVLSDAQAEDDDVNVYDIELRSDRCYRFLAVGAHGISDLDSAIADGQGDILLRDVYEDAAPILGPESPFCPLATGKYKFVVSVARGEGAFHFQVWQGLR